MSVPVQQPDPYRLLQQHLDRQAVGFPATKSGADIRLLRTLFTPDEARVALNLSYRPTPQGRVVEAAAKEFTAEKTGALLESAFLKGAIGWRLRDGVSHWNVMPVVIGMFEMQDGDPSPEFLTAVGRYFRTMDYGRAFISVKPSQMRTIPIRKSVTVEHHIATYDEIRSLVRDSGGPFVILKCICRESERIQGHTCKQTARLETCLGMGDMASMTLRRGHGREIGAEEALSILQLNEDEGLVLQPANAQRAEFVCSCCGCCCGMLNFQKRLPNPVEFWTSNYSAHIDADSCAGCGICVKRCLVGALDLKRPGGARVNMNRCIGCGLCVPACPKKAISLIKKTEPTVPPKDEEELLDTIKSNRKHGLAQVSTIVRTLLRRHR
jgi:ferredoxin